MKKTFTLIELIVVIAIIGILSTIIVPNISNMKGKASAVAMQSDIRSLQTAVDMYTLENNGSLPTVGVSEALQASELDFTKMYPDYIRNLPKEKGAKFWVDVNGVVWGSKKDIVPVTNNNGTLSWPQSNDGLGYTVYEVNSKGVTGKANSIVYKKVLEINNSLETTYTGISGRDYAVSAIDDYGNLTAPMGRSVYAGYVDTLESIKKPSKPDVEPETPTETEPPTPTNNKPIATLKMTPEQGIITKTTINWDTTSSYDEDGDNITTIEWRVNGVSVASPPTKFPTSGQYTVEVRVQDSKGSFSDWTSKSFFVMEAPTAQDIIVGGAYSIALLSDGSLQSWGNNSSGQLNVGDTTARTIPTTVLGITNIKKVVAGGQYAIALMNDGTVQSWGYNVNGQLGLGDMLQHSNTTTIPGLTNVKDIFAGRGHTFAILNDGTVKSWGNNAFGQLGLGDTADHSIPTTIAGLTDVKEIFTGFKHTFAVMNDGTVKAWGANTYGQLGFGNIDSYLTPTTVPGLTNVKKITGGDYHSIALMNDGTVKTWGNNAFGQLGLGDTTERNIPTTIPSLNNVKDIATGNDYAVALLDDGTAESWGNNTFGQLGLGDKAERLIPTTIPTLSNVKKVVSGNLYIVVLLNDTTIKAWGDNSSGQLGLGDKVERLIPTTVTLD